MLDNLMKEWAKGIDVEKSLATEVPGTYAIPLEDGLTITLSETLEGCKLSCNVATCDRPLDESFLTDMMLANLFGQGTMDASLGLSLDGQTLILTYNIDHDVSYNEFKDIVEDFISSADVWREEALKQKISN